MPEVIESKGEGEGERERRDSLERVATVAIAGSEKAAGEGDLGGIEKCLSSADGEKEGLLGSLPHLASICSRGKCSLAFTAKEGEAAFEESCSSKMPHNSAETEAKGPRGTDARSADTETPADEGCKEKEAFRLEDYINTSPFELRTDADCQNHGDAGLEGGGGGGEEVGEKGGLAREHSSFSQPEGSASGESSAETETRPPTDVAESQLRSQSWSEPIATISGSICTEQDRPSHRCQEQLGAAILPLLTHPQRSSSNTNEGLRADRKLNLIAEEALSLGHAREESSIPDTERNYQQVFLPFSPQHLFTSQQFAVERQASSSQQVQPESSTTKTRTAESAAEFQNQNQSKIGAMSVVGVYACDSSRGNSRGNNRVHFADTVKQEDSSSVLLRDMSVSAMDCASLPPLTVHESLHYPVVEASYNFPGYLSLKKPDILTNVARSTDERVIQSSADFPQKDVHLDEEGTGTKDTKEKINIDRSGNDNQADIVDLQSVGETCSKQPPCATEKNLTGELSQTAGSDTSEADCLTVEAVSAKVNQHSEAETEKGAVHLGLSAEKEMDELHAEPQESPFNSDEADDVTCQPLSDVSSGFPDNCDADGDSTNVEGELDGNKSREMTQMSLAPDREHGVFIVEPPSTVDVLAKGRSDNVIPLSHNAIKPGILEASIKDDLVNVSCLCSSDLSPKEAYDDINQPDMNEKLEDQTSVLFAEERNKVEEVTMDNQKKMADSSTLQIGRTGKTEQQRNGPDKEAVEEIADLQPQHEQQIQKTESTVMDIKEEERSLEKDCSAATAVRRNSGETEECEIQDTACKPLKLQSYNKLSATESRPGKHAPIKGSDVEEITKEDKAALDKEKASSQGKGQIEIKVTNNEAVTKQEVINQTGSAKDGGSFDLFKASEHFHCEGSSVGNFPVEQVSVNTEDVDVSESPGPGPTAGEPETSWIQPLKGAAYLPKQESSRPLRSLESTQLEFLTPIEEIAAPLRQEERRPPDQAVETTTEIPPLNLLKKPVDLPEPLKSTAELLEPTRSTQVELPEKAKKVELPEEANKVELLDEAKKVELLEEAKKVELLEEAKKVELLEEAKKLELREEAKKVELLEEAKKVELLEEAKKVELLEEAKKVELLEEAKKVELLEEAKKVELLEEAKKVELLEEAKKVELLEEAKKVELLEEAKKVELLEEAKKVELLEEAKKLELLEEANKVELPEEANKVQLPEPTQQTVELPEEVKTVELLEEANKVELPEPTQQTVELPEEAKQVELPEPTQKTAVEPSAEEVKKVELPQTTKKEEPPGTSSEEAKQAAELLEPTRSPEELPEPTQTSTEPLEPEKRLSGELPEELGGRPVEPEEQFEVPAEETADTDTAQDPAEQRPDSG
ncbi:Paternally-expressed gene 3 protein [Liparis tanakae]|uniref:Paternally-expressed gene 3 protein n=1 Tax=Liparis tanakae TaxID=230148 RepID=A0A4Z2GJA1_9TELE|nr:Paternally-expressed gene 3 protein [Liparis tanakae]